MDRTTRFEVLAQAPAAAMLELAEAVLAEADIVVTTAPRVGMVMLRLREPVDGAVFNAGEVLVTEAQVAWGDHRGYALRLGREPEAALAAAVLDVAVEAGHPLTPTLLAALTDMASAEQARQAMLWQAVAPTRVSFEEMQQ
jgi:alpha-D-ribose 1-methylphosphonate 5-triphosphate synthase subunit PhnG